jgi:hypothetical protein
MAAEHPPRPGRYRHCQTYINRAMRAARLRALSGALSGMSLSGCGGLQSALDPAGREAERLADIF